MMELNLFLDGNKTKIMKQITFFLILTLTITQSCFQKTDKIVSNQESQIVKKDTTTFSLYERNDTIVKNLADFYKSYISINAGDEINKNALNKLKSEYITNELLDKLQKLQLDYDPFVNAQDYNLEWLKNIKISEDKSKKNTYKVIINDNGSINSISVVIKKELNQYKINDINNLPTVTGKTQNNENYSSKEVTGTWKVYCEEKRSSFLFFDSSHGYLDIYMNNDYARVSVEVFQNTDVKYSVLTGITRHNKFVNWLDISTDSIVCKIKRIDDSKLEMEWLGFYNKKTKKREMVKNPFNNLNQNKSIELINCE